MARGEGKATAELIELAVETLEHGHPMTVRQLFYRLVSSGTIENNKADYQRVIRLMTKAREDDRCPWGWIVDRTRPTYSPNVFDDPAGYAEVVKRSYRRDYWQDQPFHIEVWSEKDTIIGTIAPVTDELGVTVRVGRGFMSCTRAREIAEHLAASKKRKRMVFYLGDHDPSGCEIEHEMEQRIRDYGSGFFKLDRLAIHHADIARFNLPPLKVKTSDPRAAGFLDRHVDECVELDALPVEELRRRVDTAIRDLIDQEKWNRAVMIEQAELASIVETVGAWRLGDRP